MQVHRFDGISVDIILDEPRIVKVENGNKMTKGHCTVCMSCWIMADERSGKVRCLYAGPFVGYVNTDTGIVTTGKE